MRIISIVFLACLVASCKKDYNDSALEAKKHVTAGKWFLRLEVRKYLDATRKSDSFIYQPTDCVWDNFALYLEDGSGYIDQGTVICQSWFPQRNPFFWYLSGEGTKLNSFVFNSDSAKIESVANITKLDTSEMWLTYPANKKSEEPNEYTMIFKRQ